MKIEEILLLMFGKVSGEGDLKDFVDMKASPQPQENRIPGGAAPF